MNFTTKKNPLARTGQFINDLDAYALEQDALAADMEDQLAALSIKIAEARKNAEKARAASVKLEDIQGA